MTEPYRAFGNGDAPQAGVDIRKLKWGFGVSYRLIRGVSYDNRGDGEGFILNLWDSVKISVQGRNLQPVARALIAETCVFVEQRDPERSGPPEDGQPDIERIETIEASSFSFRALRP